MTQMSVMDTMVHLWQVTDVCDRYDSTLVAGEMGVCDEYVTLVAGEMGVCDGAVQCSHQNF